VTKVRLIADARREFLREVAYYEDIRKGLGRRFRVAATAAFRKAAESPSSGKPGVAATRRILVKGFPFAVVYIPSETEVTVYAVGHLSRKPEYWLDRLNAP
jgi:plasmid stabilization system protein ParE